MKLKKNPANENAIIDKLKAVFQNKITVKIELNSMNLIYKMLNTENIGLFDLHSSYCSGTI
jgi:lipoprotein-releasing system permease protein